MSRFQKATKKQARARLALIGPSGSGKTYSALAIATNLGQRVAVIDSERGSASKYAGVFDFDVLELETFEPATYVQAIKDAEAEGYDVLVIDSLSHAWMGKGGALEQVDQAAKRSQSRNSFDAWRSVTPMHNALVDALLQSRCHIIASMRAKTEYVLETNDRGKQVPRKVGMAPVQRDGLEYEFDVVADIDLEHNMLVSKSRCPQLTDAVINKPGKVVADVLRAWLTDGAQPVEPPKQLDPADEWLARMEQAQDIVTLMSVAQEIKSCSYAGPRRGPLGDAFRAHKARIEAAREAPVPGIPDMLRAAAEYGNQMEQQ